jgi:hypothetical protein
MKNLVKIKNVTIYAAVISLCILSSCTAYRQYQGIGSKNPFGQKEGKWLIYHQDTKRVLGIGNFINDKPDGEWYLFDFHGVLVAELIYSHGVLNGPYKLYYSSNAFPKATGVRKTTGNSVNDRLQGEFTRYLPNGEPLVNYIVEHGVVAKVMHGDRATADSQLNADRELLERYYVIITKDSSIIKAVHAGLY